MNYLSKMLLKTAQESSWGMQRVLFYTVHPWGETTWCPASWAGSGLLLTGSLLPPIQGGQDQQVYATQTGWLEASAKQHADQAA